MGLQKSLPATSQTSHQCTWHYDESSSSECAAARQHKVAACAATREGTDDVRRPPSPFKGPLKGVGASHQGPQVNEK